MFSGDLLFWNDAKANVQKATSRKKTKLPPIAQDKPRKLLKIPAVFTPKKQPPIDDAVSADTVEYESYDNDVKLEDNNEEKQKLSSVGIPTPHIHESFKETLAEFDNARLITSKEELNKTPLPGMETYKELMDSMRKDQYYTDVVINSQLPRRQIFLGLLLLLLTLCIESYIHAWPVSVLCATLFLVSLYLKTNSSTE